MATKSITERREDPPGWQSGREEVAPSTLRQDEPTVARFLGMVGAALLIFGGTILLLQWWGWRSAVGSGWVTLAIATGLAALLFHAAYDRDIQFRRMYLTFGGVALLAGITLCLVHWLQNSFLAAEAKPGDWFTTGVGCLLLAILFILAPLRHEDVPDVRRAGTTLVGAVGGILALTGFGLGMINPAWLAPYGVVLPLVGLFYLVAYVGLLGSADDMAYGAGWGIGFLGLAVFLIALFRSVAPVVINAFRSGGPEAGEYFVPAGILLMLFGLVYVLASLLIVSDSTLVVMIRRELGAFFYSPIIYIVLLAFTVAHWLAYVMFLFQLLPDPATGERNPAIEPIVAGFILQWTAIFCNLFVIPALTMRLLSEESRSGTLEVLLTAPVTEAGIVLSKFIAGLLLYLIVWAPFGVLLICLRVMTGVDFDYLPLLSFGVILLFTGASFVAMGLLFSSLTRDQVASGVLTFAAMLTLTLIFLLQRLLFRDQMAAASSPWALIMKHISYIDLWISALEGKLVLRYLMFPASLTVFCLFLTIKVLESRKWK
jgi:ABC-2 type transport system permease protein